MKVLGNFLRDLTLDCKQLIQIAVVFLSPDVRVGARVDQLRVQVNPITAPACASFQHMRHPKRIADLAHISFAAVFHHAGPADDFEVGDLRQLGQNVVLHTIGERRVFFLVAQVFKRQNGDPGCYWLPDKFTFPNDPSSGRRQSQPEMPREARWLDCAAPISFLARKFQCAAPESVHALANVLDLRPARERKSTDALDLSRDI